MFFRALSIWFLILVCAFVNGTIRQFWLLPAFGDTMARALSTLMLSAVILALAIATIRWIGPETNRDSWVIGAMWLVLTLAFEFGFGRYVFGKPWSELLYDYDVLAGRIWILALVTAAIAPWIAARLRTHAMA